MVGEGIDNGRQKTRNHGYDVIVGGELFTGLLRSPRKTCHAKPKLKSTGAGRYQLLSRWWDAYCKKLFERLLSEKSDAVALQQIKERGALPMIDRGDIRQAIDRCSNIWASLPGAGYGQFGAKGRMRPIAKSCQRAERSERLMHEQSHRDYLRSGYLHHRLPVMGWLIITVITPLPTKPSATKMPEN